jgi:glycosyltransferase involved in cell wall biosynthesis
VIDARNAGILFPNTLMKRSEKHAVGRIGWCIEAADYDVASVRYRCLIPAFALEQQDFDSTLLTSPRECGANYYVFVKTFGSEHVKLAERLTCSGIPFALDLCDNIFSDGYRSKLKFSSAEGFCAMASMASEVVVPTEALARAVKESVPDCPEPTIIPDAAISWADHAQLSKHYAAELAEKSELQLNPRRDILRRLFVRPTRMWRRLAYYHRHPNAAIGEIRRILAPNGDAAGDNLVRSDAKRRRKAIWFGKHGTSHSDAGMKALLAAVPYLEAINRKTPVELVIVSNNRAKFDAHFRQLSIKTVYRKWSNDVVFHEMLDADAFLMPNATDPFSACKSANRALLALACGVPVVGTRLESLEPLREAVVLDDWKGGLERYFFDEDARRRDLRRAVEIIEREFSPRAIAGRWRDLVLRQPPQDSVIGRQAAKARQLAR